MNKKLLTILIVILTIGLGILIYRCINKNKVELTNETCFEITEEGVITEYKKICGDKVNIPSKINNIEVKEISSRVFKGAGLTKLVLPKTLEVIGISAFENNLIEELTIPESVKNIKPYAFYNNKIKKLNMGNVENIGIMAFNDNEMKEGFIYKNNAIIGYGGKERDSVKIPEVEIIYLDAFKGCGIKGVILPQTLKRIEKGAFADNDIKVITIPNSVDIVNDAFAGNLNLESIYIEKSIEEFDYFNTENIDKNIIKSYYSQLID